MSMDSSSSIGRMPIESAAEFAARTIILIGTRIGTRSALSMSAAAAMLAGCGGSQPPIGAPSALPQSRAIAMHAERRGSWMLPEAKSEDLIYAVGGCDGTCILSYPKGRLVGEISGYYGSADCSDSSGNVFISTNSEVLEFGHGDTTPIATYDVPYTPVGCSVDPESGSLAIVNGPFVAIFPTGSANPNSYNTLIDAHYCAYDNSGNLFVDGYDGQNYALSELPKGASAFEKLALDQSVGQPGQVQWDGEYLAYENFEGNQDGQKVGIVSLLSISGSSATIVGQTALKRVPNRLTQSWIYKGSIIAAYSVTGPNPKNIGIWRYPQGGRPTKRITKFGSYDKGMFDFTGVTVSVAPSR
jgi:hypothetical protein